MYFCNVTGQTKLRRNYETKSNRDTLPLLTRFWMKSAGTLVRTNKKKTTATTMTMTSIRTIDLTFNILNKQEVQLQKHVCNPVRLKIFYLLGGVGRILRSEFRVIDFLNSIKLEALDQRTNYLYCLSTQHIAPPLPLTDGFHC